MQDVLCVALEDLLSQSQALKYSAWDEVWDDTFGNPGHPDSPKVCTPVSAILPFVPKERRHSRSGKTQMVTHASQNKTFS